MLLYAFERAGLESTEIATNAAMHHYPEPAWHLSPPSVLISNRKQTEILRQHNKLSSAEPAEPVPCSLVECKNRMRGSRSSDARVHRLSAQEE